MKFVMTIEEDEVVARMMEDWVSAACSYIYKRMGF